MLWITEVTVVKACHMGMHNLLQGFLCLAWPQVLLAIVGIYSILLTFKSQDERSKPSWSEHPPYEQEQNTLQWWTFTVTLSTHQEKGDFNGGRGRIQTPTFSTRMEQMAGFSLVT